MTTHERQPDPADLPAPLAEDLRTLFAPAGAHAPDLDDRVLAIARNHARHRRRVRRVQTMAGAALGVAAALAISAGVLLWLRPAPSPIVPGRIAALRADFSPDADMTMLDAYALALAIRDAHDAGPSYDMNADGTIDASDVDAIARRSVSLDRSVGG